MRIHSWLGTLIILLLFISPGVSAKQWALLVGINDYVHPEIRDLRGCENDVQLMADVLREKFGFTDADMKILLSRQATRNAIIDTFKEWLIEKPQPNDVVLFYFSGHGSQVVDESGDEADAWDELLCPADLKPTLDRKQYINPILDDELSELLSQIPTDNVTVILDSCHSGTGTKSLIDAGLTFPKMIERDLILIPQKPADRPMTQRESIAVEQINKNHVLISGSAAEEVSLDAMWDDASYGGVLTRNLVKAMRQATSETSYVDLMTGVRQSVRERSHQTPQLEGNANRPIFSTRVEAGTFSSAITIPDKPFVLVTSVEGMVVMINAGSIRNVTEGSVYDIFSATETRFAGEPLATMQITSVGLRQSSGKISAPWEGIQRGCRAVESSHAHPPDQLYLRIHFAGNAAQRASLKEAFSKIPDLVIVDEPEKYADLVLDVQIQDFAFSGRLTSIDGTVLGQATASGADELADGLKTGLENAVVKKWLINLKNPNPPFKIEVSMDKGEEPVYKIGEVATFKFRAERNCYLTLLDVDTQGHVTMLFPNKYHPDNQIFGDLTYIIPSDEMKFRIRAQGPPGRELLKAIATTEPITLPEFDLSKINQTKDVFLDVGGVDEIRNLTRRLGRAFAVEKVEAEPAESGGPGHITQLPTSKFVTSEFIVEIVP
ncbi:MAG: caspase family protein [Candidatus Poribacteria bacterium]|nr:caspase family protein [Candidatus Poribacteria bacterium]